MKILHIDTHPLIVRGLSFLLAERLEFEHFHAADAASGTAIFKKEQPDLTLTEITLSDGDGLELITRLRASRPTARFIVLTFDDDPVSAAKALAAGAIGFVPKAEPLVAVLEAVDTVMRGKPWLPSRVIQDVARLRSSDRLSGFELTKRELAILNSLAYGESMNELAFKLGVSYKTIANDCASLRERFEAKSLPELVRIALQKRLID